MPRKKRDRFQLKPPPWLGELLERVNGVYRSFYSPDNFDPEVAFQQAAKAAKERGQAKVEFLKEWQELVVMGEFLIGLAMRFSDWKTSGNDHANERVGDIKVALIVDLAGRLQLDPDSILARILAMPVRQIRVCERQLECGKLFWACRPQKTCCSNACSSAMRMRKARARWKAKGALYEANRAEKERINGNL